VLSKSGRAGWVREEIISQSVHNVTSVSGHLRNKFSSGARRSAFNWPQTNLDENQASGLKKVGGVDPFQILDPADKSVT
jgi:hypothetical protein